MKEVRISMTDQEYLTLIRIFGSEHNVTKEFIKSIYEAAIKYDLEERAKRVKGISFDDDLSHPDPVAYLDFLLDLYTNTDNEGQITFKSLSEYPY